MKKTYLLALLSAAIFSLILLLFVSKKPAVSHLRLITDKKALNFLVIGDWGRRGHHMQKDVADQMAITSDSMSTDFFISTGDNFYPNGVTSISDEAWNESYENIYNAKSLQKNWYAVLGNHDYDGNVQAEIDYTKISKRWKMPAKYYSIKLPLKDDTAQKMLLVFLDTSPLITGDDTKADFSAIKTQYAATQKKWLDSVLTDSSNTVKWEIVCGHHPLFTGSRRSNSVHTKELHELLYPVFEKHDVDVYICGHDHSLQDIKPAGKTHYFISGAGSETTAIELYPEGGKFALSENGFIAFSLLSKKLLVQIINYKGDVLYKDEINKK